MKSPGNAAAEQIIRAQSIISDLTVQQAEVQAAIQRQQSLIGALAPVAEWSQTEPPEVPAEQPDEDPSPAE